MTIQKSLVKSCCGRSNWIYTVTKPIKRQHIELFQQAGFHIPERYVQSGLFYAKKNGFLATCTFGITKINARCNGNGCADLFGEFEKILESIQS